jgi:hypothetical protein
MAGEMKRRIENISIENIETPYGGIGGGGENQANENGIIMKRHRRKMKRTLALWHGGISVALFRRKWHAPQESWARHVLAKFAQT